MPSQPPTVIIIDNTLRYENKREVSTRKRFRRLLLISAAVLTEILPLRKRGYGAGGRVVVRCRAGHLFTTLWIPLASIKSLRLGPWRFQRCPVGSHWTLVTPVPEADLSEEELGEARAHPDGRLP